jgi:hypothetical protein
VLWSVSPCRSFKKSSSRPATPRATPENRTVRIARTKIEDLRASTVSLMPEGQLKTMTDKQVRDLFAYLMRKEK